MIDPDSEDFVEAVAVIGMAGRFPGARDLGEFWRNLRDGIDSLQTFGEAEMLAAGTRPETIAAPNFVGAGQLLDDVDLFDAGFFGFAPREAELLDPQHRLFMECCWQALEQAGYAVEDYDGWIGVYGGVSLSSYLFHNIASHPEIVAQVGDFQTILSTDRDYLTTRVSYKLNLKGPSVNVQTACSTSLAAVHFACQALLAYQTTIALAGGVRVTFPRKTGYLHQKGGIVSPDGHCRAFDADAAGAFFGEGVGVVALKRLSEALADGDAIHAVIRGTAMNNDGAGKVGYTAPSVEGQSEVISFAQSIAGVDPDSIQYVEAHGSATPLGDPIEVTALTQAFRARTDRRGFCALGSVKTNVGHLEAAAGVAGLLKTVLALENKILPPSLHFEKPNPSIDFESSPFFVNTEAREWPADGGPRRAGVSSFGMGGTNVHAVLEEAPKPEPAAPSRPWQLLVLSARSETALDAATANLAAHLERQEQDLADVAHTLQVGRRAFTHRRILVCKDRDDALAALQVSDPRRLLSATPETARRPVIWMLSGLGEHYPGMGAGLYRSEPVFREAVDRCAEILRPHLGLDLRQELYPGGPEAHETGSTGFDLKRLLGRDPRPAPAGRLAETWLAQPAVFVTGYALACLWKQWGVEPRGLIGYSLGEYLAACLAGVFSLEDALRVVAGRAKLIQELPAGAMLAVPLSEAEVAPLLGDDLSLAAVNGPAFSVVAGPPEAVAVLEERLTAQGKSCRRLTTTHAFHSRMMEPVAPRLAELLRGVTLRAPEVPLVSNVTGTWMTPEEAVDPEYWTRHLLRPVRFGEGLAELWREPARLLLEVGPGQALATLALQHPASAAAQAPVLRSLRHPSEQRPDAAMVLETLGRLWLSGASVDWKGFRGDERRRRVPLPTYPFERQRFFIEAARRQPAPIAAVAADAGIPPSVQAPAPADRELHARPNNLKTAYVEPRTPVEREVAGIWRELLGVRDVGAHDSFFELGGNSLLAPRLVMALNDRFGIEVPVAGLFEAPPVGAMAEGLEQIRREGLAAVAASRDLGPPDLRAEVVLDADITAGGLPLADWERPRAIVLTGSTGFLGGYLLRELLARTGARIVCPVRAGSAEEAGVRIRRNLEERGLWDPAWEGRVEPLAADLGEPRWGLSEAEFTRLAGETDVIYHCGAWVNFTYPYKVLKAVNVLGTVEALRLASRIRLKPLHFISSIAAISAVVFAGGGVAYEDRDLEHTSGLFGGYGETKWVAEQLVNIARSRGIPGATYRPGVLSGDTWTGAGNTRDMIWNVLKGCVQLGIAPVSNDSIDVTPVDYVARAIVHLSRRPESLGHAFHLPQTAPLPWRDVAPIFQDYGYDIEGISYAEWHRRVTERVPRQPDNAIFPFLSLMAAPVESEARLAELRSLAESTGSRELQELLEQGRGDVIGDERFDQANTLSGLAGSGIACPPFDAELLAKYLDYFVSIGWLPEPRDGPGREQPLAELAAG